jgi:hypothetical protein
MRMANVQEVFITKELADKFNMTPNYIIQVAKGLNLSNAEMRDAGKRTYLFSIEAVNKIGEKLNRGK